MRFWDVIASYCVKYLKSKINMKIKTALDIGALYGHLVKRLNDLGVDAYGIEVDRKFFSQRVTDKIIYDYFDKNFDSKKKYDLICLTQMIYYVQEPFKVIQKAVEILESKSGLLFITTQNSNSSEFRNKNVEIFEDDMNIILSKKNFEEIAKKLNLKIIDYSIFKSNIYLDRLRNQSKYQELKIFLKYFWKNPYQIDPDGHHVFIILSKVHNS